MLCKVYDEKGLQEEVFTFKDSEIDQIKRFFPQHIFVPVAYSMTAVSRRLYGELPPPGFEAMIPLLLAKLKPDRIYGDVDLQQAWSCGTRDTKLNRFWLGKLGHLAYGRSGKSVRLP